MTVKTFEALASGETLELRFYGPIGEGLFFGGVTAQTVTDEIARAPGFKRVVCKFNSPGGSAFEGMAIRSILASLDCETVAEVQGLAASAASIAAMGCDKVLMHVGTALMIHEARGSAHEPMDSQGLERMAQALEALNDGMAAIYAERTGKTKAEMRKMMGTETWLTAEQAVEKGFADEVIGTEEDAAAMEVAASFDLQKFGYRYVPEKFAASKRTEPPRTVIKLDGVKWLQPGDPSAQSLLASMQQIPQPSAALDAEAAAVRKRETMSIKLIAQAVGLQADADETAVMSAVQKHTQFVSELRTLTKADTFEAVLGTIRGLQAAAEQLPALTAKIEEQTKQLEDQERAAIFAADKADAKGRKLTPALETHWSTRPVAELKAFMAVAPHLVQVDSKPAAGTSQPAPRTDAAADSGTAVVEVLTHNGKSWEAMTALEKHDLHETDKARYEALKRNFAERGSPRAQSQQQRASA